MKYIPNTITSLNLASGFAAVVMASQGNLTVASWLILAAMIFDFLDGFSARLLKAYSPLGKELDSLADVVSFGVAPAFILYKLFSAVISSHEGFSSSPALQLLCIVIPAIMPVLGALRLAIFNLDTEQATSFRGLPIPANALTVISFVLAGNYSESALIMNLNGSFIFLACLSVIPSLLMVTRIPLISMKFSNLKLKGNEGRFLLIVLVILDLVIFGMAGLPLIIPFYLISSAVSLLF
jgi:CDP-diacylglycerol---serine O-phosphatidyltransferase